MQLVTVKRTSLLSKVKDNRDNHRKLFDTAQVHYREQVIKELDTMLDDAKHGRNIKRHVGIPEPEEHTRDFDRVITMLEMSVDDEIELTSQEFSMYVMNEWGWMQSFASNTMAYVGKV